jgi:hypothetical protein
MSVQITLPEGLTTKDVIVIEVKQLIAMMESELREMLIDSSAEVRELIEKRLDILSVVSVEMLADGLSGRDTDKNALAVKALVSNTVMVGRIRAANVLNELQETIISSIKNVCISAVSQIGASLLKNFIIK